MSAVTRAHLQQVAGVEPQQVLDLAASEHVHVGYPPQLLPRQAMTRERLLEARTAPCPSPGLSQRVADGGVARGEEGNHLLNPDRRSLRERERQPLLDVV